jgi:hypothetical protein
MPKKLLSVGFHFPHAEVEDISFKSNRSLLDADIIVFEPEMKGIYESYEEYNGKPVLTATDSFQAQEDCRHWRRELTAALNAGKTIFFYLNEVEEYYVYTGEKQFSGTGRSRVTTNVVSALLNYACFPFSDIAFVNVKGAEIRPAKDLQFLGAYWNEFRQYTTYEVFITGKIVHPLFMTKSGDRILGASLDNTKGAFILLPRLSQPDLPDFVTPAGNWSKQALELGNRLLSHFVEIHDVIKTNRDATPAPPWTKSEAYRLERESKLEQEIKQISAEIETKEKRRSDLLLQLQAEGRLRRLLYERGHPLEEAILEALTFMGFQAEPFKDAESEFDAVIVSAEGRLIGEAEGKDNSQINIDKLAQLERNINEDFAREEVQEHAKGVLFGNAFRLQPVGDRPEFFTDKCRSGAKRTKTALVRTPDLFPIAKYLRENPDPNFAKACREAIMRVEGEIVAFPSLPQMLNVS